MKKIVFLDLEETVIMSRHNRTLINLEKIKHLLTHLKVKEVHIFSFAIDNEDDKQVFEQENFKGWLESVLEVTIATNPCVREIMQKCFSHTGNHFEMFEFKSIWGKTRAFQDFCNAMFKDCECILIDDVVRNTTLINHDSGLVIRTMKI